MKRIFLGMLTPSSNTILEPVTQAMVSGLAEVSVHFSRFKVTEIALSPSALSQFDESEILRAAELLAHARSHVIAWNGTSSGWLGFEADHRLCRHITAATGVRATTSMLALNEILERTAVKRVGLVTPYLDDVQAKIVANYTSLGFSCVAERHLAIRDNFSFSEVPADRIRAMTREVAAAGPDAVAIICTNLCGAPLVEELEREVGIPIYDSVSTVVWKSLVLAGIDPKRITGWGRLFRELG
jgi:maleate isomerase